MSPWVFDPQSGGSTIPKRDYEEIRATIHAKKNRLYPTSQARLDIRFRGVFCYTERGHKMRIRVNVALFVTHSP